MIAFAKTFWPPTRSCGTNVLWAFLLGAVLQIALPVALGALGFTKAAIFAIYPGLFPTIWATGGWFAGIAPLGYVILFTVNTVVYSVLVFGALRICVRLQRLCGSGVPAGNLS